MLKQRGFSLIELMIAIAVGLVISSALSLMFVSSTKARQEINRFGEQIENGRIAMDLMGDDLRTAGYWDTLDPSKLTAPATLPNPCATDAVSLKAAVPVSVQGYDNSSGGLSCISDVRAGTDVLVIRRAGTCAVGGAGCSAAMIAGVPYIQASHCNPPASRLDGTVGTVLAGAELSSSNPTDWYAVDTTSASLTLHKIDCANASLAGAPNLAEIRPYIVHIYFVSNNTRGTDGIPALKMAAFDTSGASATPSFIITTIATGIEQLQIEYGEDTNGDGSPDLYTAAPAALSDWMNVVSAKINLLSRNTSQSLQFTDTKTYQLGNKADGTVNQFGPYNDAIRRHAYMSVILLSNPAGLRSTL